MDARLHSPARLRIILALVGIAVLLASAFGIHFAMSENGLPSSGATLMQPASAPQPVPELRFQSAEGEPLALSDFRGKFVLLNVWATWCVPCRKEMPALDRLQQKLGGSDFAVVALSIDRGGPAAVRLFYEEIDIRTLDIYIDPGAEATATLKTVGIPTTLLVDREGRELWRRTGPAEWDSPRFLESLRRHMGGAPS